MEKCCGNYEAAMKSLLDEIEEFIVSKIWNKWINTPLADVYVRKSRRIGPNERIIVKTLDVASITMHEEGRGTFHGLLPEIMKLINRHGIDYVYIENVLDERFAKYLARHGGKQTGQAWAPPSFFFRARTE